MSEDDKPVADTPPPARVDPMAKARAAKAAKEKERADAALAQAEKAAASAAHGQPVVSTMRGRAVNPFMGELVEVKITHWGHAEVSTGGEDGFERFAAGAITKIPEQSARSLFNKRWIEPIDKALADKWLNQNRQELLAAMRAKGRTEARLQAGVGVGEEWRSALEGGELAFNPTERDLKAIGIGNG